MLWGLEKLSPKKHPVLKKYAQAVWESAWNKSRHNNNIIILDDLMAQATDSPVVSRLFTRGPHRNLCVILLLQNMFPKGKYNTPAISRIA